VLLDRPWRAIAKSLVFWFALTIPIMLVARFVQPAADVTPVPLWARPLVAMDALGFYLAKLAAPVGLTNNYGRTPQFIIARGTIYYAWIIPAAVAAALALARSRRLTAAVLLFIAGVLPVLGLTTFLYQQFSTVADRFVYLSMLGPAAGVAFILSRRWTRGSVILAAAVLVVLGVMTVRQSLVWRNRLTLAEHAVKVQPDNPAARSSYAGALMRQGRIDEAIVQLQHVMTIMPNEGTKELIEQLRASARPMTPPPPRPSTTQSSE
jgi:protein O-mannosyl-transferase